MKTIIREFLLKLKVIFCPIYWNSINMINYKWDKKLRQLILNKSKITEIEKYTIKIDKYKIWISNYPYGFGNVHSQTGLPKRTTRILLRDYLSENDIYI